MLPKFSFPNYAGLSDQSLRELHEQIAACLDEDDQNKSPEKKYGVRQLPDWKIHLDAIQSEMATRGMKFRRVII